MTTVVSVAQGGTGSNSAALARTALGVPPSAAYDQANTARDQANSAYSDANTRLSASGGTLAGDLIITGNLTVSGNSTTLNAEILTIEDADVVLLSNVASTPALNAGIIVNRGTSTNTFLRWDEVTDKWGWSDDGSTTYKFTSALDAYAQANSAYGAANNRVLKAGDTMTGQLNISSGGLLVTGNSNFDSGTLFVDSVNDRIGVGTTNPSEKFQVDDTTPAVALRIQTSNTGNSANNYSEVQLADNGAVRSYWRQVRDGSGAVIFSYNDHLRFYQQSTEVARLTLAGNFGIGTTSPGAKLHVSGGGIRIPANTWIDSENSVNLIRDGRFGYSDSYRVVQIGINSGTRAISLGYDPSVNLSGGFNGGEIVIPNNRAIIAPTSDNSTYIGVLRVDSANNLCIGGGNYQTSGYIFVNNTTGNVSIGTGTAGEKLSVNGAIESLVDAGGGASEGGQIVLRAPAGGNTRWNMDNYTNKFRIFREDDSNKANGAAFFHIINGGNVGIGTDNPSRRLHIVNGSSGANVDSTATQVVIENSADAGIHIMNPNGNIGRVMFGTPARMPSGLIRWDNTNNNFDFSTDKSGAYIRFLTDLFQERMRIVSGGAVGINYTNPAGYGQLTVNWDVTNTANNNGVGLAIRPAADTTDAYFAIFFNSTGSGIGSIRRVGTTNAVAYNTSSDRRLKENIVPAQSASSIIDNIEVVQYDWKEGTHVRHGIIAQDLYSVAPEAVSIGDSEEIENPRNPWGVDYSKLVPMLIKEIQELRARIATLELGNN